jgi:hypothetical protein
MRLTSSFFNRPPPAFGRGHGMRYKVAMALLALVRWCRFSTADKSSPSALANQRCRDGNLRVRQQHRRRRRLVRALTPVDKLP